MQQKDICDKLIDSMSRIATGKFTKSEHKDIVNASEELKLRTQATSILV